MFLEMFLTLLVFASVWWTGTKLMEFTTMCTKLILTNLSKLNKSQNESLQKTEKSLSRRLDDLEYKLDELVKRENK